MKQFYSQSFQVCLILIFNFFAFCSEAQITITAGSGYTDAVVINSLTPAEAYKATTNFGTYPRMDAAAWTHSGAQITYRSLIQFNLSSIPSGTVVQSAVLYLYSDPANLNNEWSNISLTGSNDIYFQRINASWNPTTVTWNTQPTTRTTGRVYVGPSTSATENITVDLTAMVQDMVTNPAGNFGIMMNLASEVYYRSRAYASSDHANAALHPKLVVTLVTDPIRQKMDSVFGSLNQSYINTGILTDFGLDLADPTIFNGVVGTTNETTMNTWRELYGSLLSSVINPSSGMIPLSTINQQIETYWNGYNKTNPLVDIATLFVSYQSLRSDAVTQNLISVTNNVLHDVAGRTQSPYTTSYAFASAPNLGFDNDGFVTFIFRNSLFVNSSTKTFSSFSVDFGDGLGYQTMVSDVPQQVQYATSGFKQLTFKIQFTDGSVYYSWSNFNVGAIYSSGNPQARYTTQSSQAYRFPRSSDVTCPESSFPNPNTTYGANVTVSYGTYLNDPRPTLPNCSPMFIKPLIVLEGYDISKFGDFGIPNHSFFDFAIDPSVEGYNGNMVLPMYGDNFLNDALQSQGFDIVFVDFDNGTGDIIQSALLVENIIKWVNAHKINDPSAGGIREKNILLGQSMGGLIGRYAICDMEKNPGGPSGVHEVSKLFTQDSPHRGANVPLGFQAMVNDLATMSLTKIGLSSYGIIGGVIGSQLQLRDLVPVLHQADQLLEEPASQQMLIEQDGTTNTFLDGAYRNMITFTAAQTPQSFIMRAMSNGSECGIGQLLQPGGEIFDLEANFYVNRLLFQAVGTAVFTNAFAIDPGLGAIVAVPFLAMEPFTGKNWKIKFNASAAPSSGTNVAYTGNILFQKKILGLISLPSTTVFNKSRNSISGVLPWDSAPGGYYDLKRLQAKVPANPNINAYPIIDVNLNVRLATGFAFVPTVSSLDISTTPITSSALGSPFTNGNNATYSSRFANYITQQQTDDEINKSANNSRHIQFTTQNAKWFYNEVIGQPNNIINCSYRCSGTPSSPTISGPTRICNLNSVYSINNLPSNVSTFTWSKSDNLNAVSLNTLPTYTVNSSASGSGTTGYVTVVLNGDPVNGLGCGDSDPIQLNLTFGGFSSSDYPISGPTSICKNSSANYSTVQLQGATGYTWTWPNTWSGYPNNQYLSVTTNDGSIPGPVTVRVANACDPGGSPSMLIVQVGTTCGNFVVNAFPNPATQTLTVQSVESAAPSTEISTDQVNTVSSTTKSPPPDFSVKLFDGNAQLRQSGKSKEGKVSLDVSTLPNGNYHLWITTDLETTSTEIIIWH